MSTEPINPFAPAPEPVSELGRYRVLSPKAGVRVSPLCLGGASIGQEWASFWGSMTKEQSFKLLDTFYENGGNFIDTANGYQNNESETWIGEWMTKTANRDEMVIATKYSSIWQFGAKQIKANYVGNQIKSMVLSLEASLKKLQTNYVDIFYVHWWDWTTSVEEVMQGLNNLVRSGKVLYLGISDTPAWVVSDANRYAREHGLAQFVVYQGKWSVGERDFEREIIPMCRQWGMAIAPFGAAGSGKYQSAADLEARKKSGESLRSFGSSEQTESEKKMSAALEKVANELGTKSVTAVALAYVAQKTPYVFPIIGGRKVEHLLANIESLSLHLTNDQVSYLESIIPFKLGFPLNILGVPPQVNGGQLSQTSWLMAPSGRYSFVQAERAIKPAPPQ